MSKHKMRTRVASTIAALSLFPGLALAQAGSSPENGETSDSARDSASESSQQPGARGSSSQQGSQGEAHRSQSERGTPGQPSQGHSTSGSSASEKQPGMTGGAASAQPGSESQASADRQVSSAQQSIDPSQIQRVLGTDTSLIDLSSLDTEEVRGLQQTLQQRGFYRGDIDGVVGPKTRSALTSLLQQQFALNQRLVNRGQLTEQFASSLGIDAQGISPVRGIDMGSMGRQPGQQQQPSQQQPSQQGQQQQPGQQGEPSPSDPMSPSSPSEMDSSERNPSTPPSGSVNPTTPPSVEDEETQ